MRQILAGLLAILLAFPVGAQGDAEAEARRKVTAIGQGYMAEVRLQSGEKLTGRIGEIREREFVLEEVRERKLQDEEVAFAAVAKVKGPLVKQFGVLTRIAITCGVTAASILIARLIARARR